MATLAIQLTTYTKFTVDYTLVNNDTTYGVVVNSYSFQNTRSNGTNAKVKVWLEFGVYRDNLGGGYVSGPGEFGSSAKTTIAVGTKDKPGIAVGRSAYRSKTHASEKLYVLLFANMESSENWRREMVIADTRTVVKSNYAVTYNANKGSGSTGSQTKWYGENLALQSNGFTRSGYAFKRWNTNAYDTGTAYNAGATYTGNAALTLYAIWNRTVSYNGNAPSGFTVSGVPASQTAPSTSAITLSGAAPTCRGWKFMGWATSASGSAAYQPGAAYAADNPSCTLYAVWQRQIDSVTIGDAKAVRVSGPSSTAEADEGTYAYVTVPYTVSGAALADMTLTASCAGSDGSTPAVTRVSYTGTKPAAGSPTSNYTVGGTFTARVNGGLDVNKQYTLSITVTAVNRSVSPNTSHAVTKSVTVPPAFFTMDVLGDGYQGQDTGHGVSFGAPATHEGFNVSMPMYAYDRRIYPCVVIWDNITTEAAAQDAIDLIIDVERPFFVYIPSNNGIYWEPQ